MLNQSKVGNWFPLVLISSLGLFLELAVIRWISVEVRLLAYFKNLPLLAAYLGLAIGFALVNKREDYKKTFTLMFLIFTFLVLSIGRFSSQRSLAYPSTSDEFLWYTAPISFWSAIILFLGIIAIFFLITLLLFIPIGQATGEEMARHKPVPAYIVNIAASLLGIWVFSLFSFLQTSPLVWFGLGLSGIALYIYLRTSLRRRDIAFIGLSLVCLLLFKQDYIWSPYQRLSVTDFVFRRISDNQPVKVGYTLNVQQVFFQNGIDLSQEFVSKYGNELQDLENTAYIYNLPYRLLAPGSKVLIVGSGMGNDVAAAIRNDMGSIDAVEIDPAILRLGFQLHPEKPYVDPRVNRIADDARSFLVKSNERYDLVVFGFLDSHILLSSLSNVRLDSYVYTLECFQQVKEHLDEGGIVVVTFAAQTDWLAERLGRMMREIFGYNHVYYQLNDTGVIYVAGNLTSDQIQRSGLVLWSPNKQVNDLPLPNDNWPYLYMRYRRIPGAYWQALLFVGILALLLMRRSFPEALHPDLQFWLLGAGFLLIEFTSITRLALLFGTTWLVNALAISGVLLMILGANTIVLRAKSINLRLVYVVMFVSLGLVYFFPLEALNQLAPLPRAISSISLLSLPLFFSGMIFSELLRRAGETARPLASNLSGSVFGGVLEYTAIWWGVQSLYITAFIVYILAFLLFLRSYRKSLSIK